VRLTCGGLRGAGSGLTLEAVARRRGPREEPGEDGGRRLARGGEGPARGAVELGDEERELEAAQAGQQARALLEPLEVVGAPVLRAGLVHQAEEQSRFLLQLEALEGPLDAREVHARHHIPASRLST